MKAEEVTFTFVEEEESVLLKKTVEAKIKYLLKKYEDLEWMTALLGEKRDDGTWVVKDLYIMEQEVTGGHVDPTTKGNLEVAELTNCIGWIHSHNNMKAFFSGTDWETAEMYDVSLCVNNDFHFYGSCLKEVDCPQSNAHGKKIMKKIDVYLESNVLSNRDIEKIDKACEEKITEKKFTNDYSYGQSGLYNKYDVYKENRGYPIEPGSSITDWDMDGEEERFLGMLKEQPFLTEYFAEDGLSSKLNQTEFEAYAANKKKKVIKEFGKHWNCPLCGQPLGRKHKKISYSVNNDMYVHTACYEEYFKASSYE